ncbi:hypothetical protein LOTGIDRAFT_159127 [Lottia gigantea]|uniref:Uncharacterized protein n=1 Tax=Lottia gigantea TaxID=225164 RepID=V4AXM6_LOTGI|nr:hypothetical protein LOTGIDRAFT_159127 [Lottia gigantea]ESO98326.1 hypothetical protein LOTGIDRAFT_159127 [Lottia gigantea]
MPVASSPTPQDVAPIVHLHHLLQPKGPTCINSGASNICSADSTTFMPERSVPHISGRSPSHSLESPSHFISTHSPPLLNLSPNLNQSAQLSPTDQQGQRSSQFYDLRESTRRQSIQDVHLNLSQQMQHSPQLLSGILAAVEDSDRKEYSRHCQFKDENLYEILLWSFILEDKR